MSELSESDLQAIAARAAGPLFGKGRCENAPIVIKRLIEMDVPALLAALAAERTAREQAEARLAAVTEALRQTCDLGAALYIANGREVPAVWQEHMRQMDALAALGE